MDIKKFVRKLFNSLGYEIRKLPRKQSTDSNLGRHFAFGTDIPGRREITSYFIEQYPLAEILDIGCGAGNSVRQFAEKDIAVKGIDMLDPDMISFPDGCTYEKVHILEYSPSNKHEAIYASHVIEHLPDTEQFINSIFNHLNEGGHFCIIWPKPKPDVVSGHVHNFNIGMMLYNLVRTGIDCQNVQCVDCQYSLAIMGKYNRFEVPLLTHNEGDIERLSAYFPFPATQGFNGDDVPGSIYLK